MTTTRTWWAKVAALVLVGVAVVGCSSGTDDAATSGGRDDGALGGAAAEGADGAASGEAGVPDGEVAGEQVARERQVVYTGFVTVRVDDVEAAAARAATLADEAGGYLANQRSRLTGEREATVTLRVPSESFDEVMADLARLGAVRDRVVDSEDVTDQVVDLRERLENARTSAGRLRELLAEAENVQNVIAIEDRLTQRETEIELLTGTLEVLEDRTAFATVDATFVERDQPSVSDDLPGPLEALRAGVVTLANVLLALVALGAFALPFVPFVAGGWWLVRRWRRRRLPPPPG